MKQLRVTSSDQESRTKSNKTVERAQVTLSDEEDSEKTKTDNRPRATLSHPENSKKSDKTDDRYLFDVTFDDLVKSSVLPTQRTTPNGRLGILNCGDQLELKGIQ